MSREFAWDRAKLATYSFSYAWSLFFISLSVGCGLEQFHLRFWFVMTIAGGPMVLFPYGCYAVDLFSYLCDCNVCYCLVSIWALLIFLANWRE